MDHLLLLLLLLWSSGLGGGGRLASAAAQCEAAKADIVLLMDESGSISQPDFRKMLQFVEDIIKIFNIGPDAVQIGLTLFATAPRTVWELNTHQTKESLLNAISSLYQAAGATYTGKALEHVLRYNFKYDRGMRPNSRKILLVVTDGESQDNVVEPAKQLRDSGIEVYAIGVGGASHHQLLMMTTDRALIYILKDFSSLVEIVDSFSISLCNSAKSRDPTVFFIRLTLLLLSLLIFTSLICFSHKIARKYKRRPQEDVEVELQTRRRILQEDQI